MSISTEYHLNAIVTRCIELLATGDKNRAAEAGWISTIAAIEWSQEIDCLENDMIRRILASWPPSSLGI